MLARFWSGFEPDFQSSKTQILCVAWLTRSLTFTLLLNYFLVEVIILGCVCRLPFFPYTPQFTLVYLRYHAFLLCNFCFVELVNTQFLYASPVRIWAVDLDHSLIWSISCFPFFSNISFIPFARSKNSQNVARICCSFVDRFDRLPLNPKIKLTSFSTQWRWMRQEEIWNIARNVNITKLKP